MVTALPPSNSPVTVWRILFRPLVIARKSSDPWKPRTCRKTGEPRLNNPAGIVPIRDSLVEARPRSGCGRGGRRRSCRGRRRGARKQGFSADRDVAHGPLLLGELGNGAAADRDRQRVGPAGPQQRAVGIGRDGVSLAEFHLLLHQLQAGGVVEFDPAAVLKRGEHHLAPRGGRRLGSWRAACGGFGGLFGLLLLDQRRELDRRSEIGPREGKQA